MKEKEEEALVFIDGTTICLQPQNSDHKDLYVKWLNDPKVRKYSRNIIPMMVENTKKWFEPRGHGLTNFLALEIWHKEDKKPIGNVMLTNIDWINGWANVGLTIGEPKYWNKNIATEATELILEYAFNELNLHKLHGGVIINNIGSWTVAEKTGFVLEGIQKHEFFVDGEFLDVKRYRILKEDWLKRKKE